MKTLKAFGCLATAIFAAVLTITLTPLAIAKAALIGAILLLVGYKTNRRPNEGDFSAKRYWYEAKVSGLYLVYLAAFISFCIRLEPTLEPVAIIAFLSLGFCCAFLVWIFSCEVRDAIQAESHSED